MLGLPPALWKLQRLQLRAMVRRIVRQSKTPKGAVLSIISLGLLILWIGPSVAVAIFQQKDTFEHLDIIVTLSLFGVFLTQMTFPDASRLLALTPTEVQFLLSSPFSRRELLAYHLRGIVVLALFMAGFFSLFGLQFVPSWPSAFIGLFLALLFVQLVWLVIAFSVSILTQGTYAWVRVGVLLAALAGVSFGVWQVIPDMTTFEFAHIGAVVEASPVYRYGLAPFRLFGAVITADSFLFGALPWAALGIGVNALLVALLVYLDADFRERSIAAGAKQYEQVQRMRSGRSMLQLKRTNRPMMRVPKIPRMGGAGLMLRRQLLGATRSSLTTWLVVLVVVAGISAGLMPQFLEVETTLTWYVIALAIGSLYFALFAGSLFRMDFRGELEMMDRLKTLPLRPYHVALGEVLAPTFLASLVQCLFAITAGALSGYFVPLAGIALLFLPVNLIVFSVENFFFLLYPVRAAGNPGDIQLMGLTAVIFMAKTIVLMVLLGVAAGVAGLAILFDASIPIALAAAGVTALVIAVLSTLPLAWAFERFDPSAQTIG